MIQQDSSCSSMGSLKIQDYCTGYKCQYKTIVQDGNRPSPCHECLLMSVVQSPSDNILDRNTRWSARIPDVITSCMQQQEANNVNPHEPRATLRTLWPILQLSAGRQPCRFLAQLR